MVPTGQLLQSFLFHKLHLKDEETKIQSISHVPGVIHSWHIIKRDIKIQVLITPAPEDLLKFIYK